MDTTDINGFSYVDVEDDYRGCSDSHDEAWAAWTIKDFQEVIDMFGLAYVNQQLGEEFIVTRLSSIGDI